MRLAYEKPAEQKFTKAANAFARVRMIYKELPESEQKGLYDRLEEEGF